MMLSNPVFLKHWQYSMGWVVFMQYRLPQLMASKRAARISMNFIGLIILVIKLVYSLQNLSHFIKLLIMNSWACQHNRCKVREKAVYSVGLQLKQQQVNNQQKQSNNRNYLLQHLLMKLIYILNLILLLTLNTNCGRIFLGFTLQNTSYYQCYLQGGNSKIILDINQENNAIDKDSIQNVQNAKNGGVAVQGLLSSCRNRTIQQQVQIISAGFPGQVFDRIWVHLPTDQVGCGWSPYPQAQNCQYLQDLISGMTQKFRIPISIYTDRKTWYKIFKNYQACPAVSGSLLWYVPEKIPEQPNFNDYQQIGGWSQPYLKIFNITTVCGATVFENYFK